MGRQKQRAQFRHRWLGHSNWQTVTLLQPFPAEHSEGHPVPQLNTLRVTPFPSWTLWGSPRSPAEHSEGHPVPQLNTLRVTPFPSWTLWGSPVPQLNTLRVTPFPSWTLGVTPFPSWTLWESPRSPAEHSEGHPFPSWTLWGSPRSPAEHWGSPRSPAEHWGSPRSPAKHWGSPRSPAKHWGSPRSPAEHSEGHPVPQLNTLGVTPFPSWTPGGPSTTLVRWQMHSIGLWRNGWWTMKQKWKASLEFHSTFHCRYLRADYRC